MIQIDTHEKKTPEALVKAFDAEVKPLKIADYLDTERRVLIEFKIMGDVRDYLRLGNETMRMNYPQYASFYRHAIYVDLWCLESFEEFLKFGSICYRANVHPHFVVWDKDFKNLIAEIKKISQPSYNKPQNMYKHNQELGQAGKIIATFPGMGQVAAPIEADLKEGHILSAACDHVMGCNKDGTPRKVAADMLTFLKDFKQYLE
jgi:hypothetical protein